MSYITVDLIENEVYQVDASTVGQYTGVNDKNGNEIYEGDIVRYHPDANRGTGAIQYVGSGFYLTGDFYSQLDNFAKDGLEIIGNIHDNLDLINGDPP